jgi:hypothetical protein
MGINDVYKQTGIKDKPSVLKFIKDLKKMCLVESSRSKTHKQKVNLQLSDLGREVVTLAQHLDDFTDSYLKLKKTVKENFPPVETSDGLPVETSDGLPASTKSKLRMHGWNDEELKEYFDYREDSYSLVSNLWKTALDFVIIRYSSILYRTKLKKNVEDFLKQTIIGWITQHIMSILNDDTRSNLYGADDDKWKKGSVGLLWVDELFRQAFDSRFHETNRFIINEAENALLAVSRIPNYNQENLITLVKQCRLEIKSEQEQKDQEFLRELDKRIKLLQKLSDSS